VGDLLCEVLYVLDEGFDVPDCLDCIEWLRRRMVFSQRMRKVQPR
jgi:hypothetical protein